MKNDSLDLSKDIRLVLKYSVEFFIEEGQPASSKSLIDKYGIKFSSAKVRYLMNDLENLGYLEKTHTSSGRIPSAKGYKYYAKYLTKDDVEIFKGRLKDIFARRRVSVEETIQEVAKIITESIGVTLVTTESNDDSTLKGLQLIPLSDSEGIVLITDSYGKTITNKIIIDPSEFSMKDLSIATKIFSNRLIDYRLIKLSSAARALGPVLSEFIKNYEQLLENYVHQVFEFNFVRKNEVYGKDKIILAKEISRPDLIKILNTIENRSIWELIDSENENDDNIKIAIGSDHSAYITKKFNNAKIKEMSIVGTNRMNYAKGISALELFEELLEEE
ncbi:heat-inducible transcriptional repressor HrcA [Mycoplasma tauri]|uniref:heat-inducible transcriptional repressor HrcA n=1 Tax=Mycoplasma tauri TaxID=547987 RepID=UPI001967CD21|nr:heat-inducible transcriptional repressor HrcA [Mycoplasma tauri]MBZ4204356.1 heat-inducible transcriptional repressor HrcA [Mycoplasma tauri]MBZ4218442.1 heat-inducible transcriptional repressor HrcA [Mycoplasma tauri]MBZ4227050.1 heat-inducible transcriptional repressor HrcA [Mycoplasma tauri]QSB07355.1 heat-inducible transcriptional repressor HrcA [Mycoplasma tauri]